MILVSSHTPSEPRPTASNLCINRCAAPKSRPSSKQSNVVFRWMSQSLSQRSHALSQPKPSHRKRPHETTPSRYLKHHHTATAIIPIRQAGSNHTSRPVGGQRQLDRRYLRTSIPHRSAQSWPFGHHRGRQQLCRKYFLFCCFCRHAHKSFIQ